MRARRLFLLSFVFVALIPVQADGMVFRVFQVRTAGVSDGLGPSGYRPAPDYHIDGGREAGLERGLRLDVFRTVTVVHPEDDRPRTLEIRFAQAEVVEAYSGSAIVRTQFVDDVESAPIVGPRAVMIGDSMVIAPDPLPEPEESSLNDEPDVSIPANVLFDFDSSTLKPAGQSAISEARDRLAIEDQQILLVEGHTCDLGSEGYNRKLSLRRAESVAGFLVAGLGLEAERIVVRGRGEERPVAPDDGDDHRYLNRRVDFHILESEEAPGSP